MRRPLPTKHYPDDHKHPIQADPLLLQLDDHHLPGWILHPLLHHHEWIYLKARRKLNPSNLVLYNSVFVLHRRVDPAQSLRIQIF